jgi:hypothetical protein
LQKAKTPAIAGTRQVPKEGQGNDDNGFYEKK